MFGFALIRCLYSPFLGDSRRCPCPRLCWRKDQAEMHFQVNFRCHWQAYHRLDISPSQQQPHSISKCVLFWNVPLVNGFGIVLLQITGMPEAISSQSRRWASTLIEIDELLSYMTFIWSHRAPCKNSVNKLQEKKLSETQRKCGLIFFPLYCFFLHYFIASFSDLMY